VSVGTESELVAAARDGDEAAFSRLTEPYARELHVHCYRMLGSIHDAEDAFQETMIRAWRHLSGFEGRSSFRAWLYRVATNVCLRAGSRRRSVAERLADYPAGETGEEVNLSPYPDALLDELPSEAAPASARYDLRESIELAFLASIQALPARQRAVLILRDVLDFSAREVAAALETTTASVNSALQRAHATLERRRAGGQLREAAAASDEAERSIVRRYMEAWEAVDVDRLVSLLREDAVLTMPPWPEVYRGREEIGRFFSTVPLEGALDKIRLVPTRANRQPAIAAYVPDESGGYRGYGIMVLTLDGDVILNITGCVDSQLFPLFGLPLELGAS
jgi:RNA polymerase sigma-70 factor (ECF subfamily)